MVQLTLQDHQVGELIRQLPPQRKREVLMELATAAAAGREPRSTKFEERFRQLARERGMDWDKMDDEQRLGLVDNLTHEDHPCAGGATGR